MIKTIYAERFAVLYLSLFKPKTKEEIKCIRVAMSMYIHLMECDKIHHGKQEPQCKEIIE